MVNEDVRAQYSGYLDVDVKGRTFMRRSLDRLSMKKLAVPEQRTKSSMSDATSREVGSTATVLAAGKPQSFSSGNPMFSGDVDGPVEKEMAKPLARARGAKAPKGKAPRGKKAAAAKKPLTTEFGSLAREDTRPIVYAVSAWCMVMPPAQAAQEVIKAKSAAARVAAQPEPELTTADSIEEGSDADDTELAPKLKPKGKKKADPPQETRARAGSFRFFRRKGKKNKAKKGDK